GWVAWLRAHPPGCDPRRGQAHRPVPAEPAAVSARPRRPRPDRGIPQSTHLTKGAMRETMRIRSALIRAFVVLGLLAFTGCGDGADPASTRPPGELIIALQDDGQTL